MGQFTREKIIGYFSAFLLAGFLAAAIFAEERPDSFEWKGQIAAGKAIEIKGVNGNIKAEAAGGSQTEVTADKKGSKSKAADIQIKVVEHENGVTICAVYPASAGDPPNECRPGSGGRMNVRNNDVKVEFKVKVPAGVRFIGRTVNGGVDANGLSGDIEAHAVNGGINANSLSGIIKANSVNGDIRISGKDAAQAETVNGSVTASLGEESVGKSLSFKTVNGGIDVTLPRGFNADADIRTVNGNITTDFPITVQGRINPKHISGKIGNGGAGLKLETVNGSVTLHNAP
jgi:DUF4097 and DUF4098 domain-containing protein YvlB